MMYPNVMVPRVSVVIDKAFGGAYCAMDSLTTSVRALFCKHYGFTTGQIAVMGKEAGPFFTYGPDGGDAAMRERQQERYENEYLNMDLAFAGNFVVPLEPEALRQRLVADIPHLYAAYQDYWRKLVHEWEQVQTQCPHLAPANSATEPYAALSTHSETTGSLLPCLDIVMPERNRGDAHGGGDDAHALGVPRPHCL